MDIDDTTTGTVADESAYIGDNCLSTPVRVIDINQHILWILCILFSIIKCTIFNEILPVELAVEP